MITHIVINHGPKVPKPSKPSKPSKPIVPTRHDTPADFFIVVGLENGRIIQERQEQEEKRVRATTSQGSLNPGYHFDTTSVDLLLPDSQQRELTPQILDRYPRQDYTNATVDPMIPAFCMPLGVTTLPQHTLLPVPSTHQFTLTTGDGSKVYGVSLKYYEAVTVGSLHLPNPTLMDIMSDEIYYEMFKLYLSDLTSGYMMSSNKKREVDVEVGESEKSKGELTEMNTLDVKDTARQSMMLWKILDQYETDVEQQQSIQEKNDIVKKLANVLLKRYGKQNEEEKKNDTPQSSNCLAWLTNTELYKELMHALEENQEVTHAKEKNKTNASSSNETNETSSSILETSNTTPSTTPSITPSSTSPTTPTPSTSTSTTSTTSTTSVIDIRMVHDVRDALESQMCPAYLSYLSTINSTIRLVPKCLVFTGRYPFFQVYESVLRSVHTLFTLQTSTSSHTSTTSAASTSSTTDLNNNAATVMSTISATSTTHTVPSSLTVSSNAATSSSALTLSSSSASAGSSLTDLSNPKSNVCLTVPIERLIVHFLDEVPLPPSGKERFEFSIAPFHLTHLVPLVRMERPPLNRLPLINLSYSILVDALSVSQIITVVTALLLDQKVIVLSEDVSKIPIVCESLCSLLFPFRWQNPYIPLLPR